jgi:hypothetical protein
MGEQLVPEITITEADLHFRFCGHCGQETMQVGEKPEDWPEGPDDEWEPGGISKGHCLQCIADGGTCCSLRAFDRWKQ